MIQPTELKLNLPMEIANGVISSTVKVWETLVASKNGDLNRLKRMINECPELIFGQYNYSPPIHFAVREGHLDMVNYLLDKGALDPAYKTYPFQETLFTIAQERNYDRIASLLDQYSKTPPATGFKGDNGKINYTRDEAQQKFEKVVYEENLKATEAILKQHPEFATDETYFWGEGIMLFAAKENNRNMIDLLMHYGARVPSILKWTQFYYFERLDAATYVMEKGMNPNTMSWHHVTILHDMAQKGNIQKAELLIRFGADINAVEEEYQSTPLGLASKWGQTEMVEYLLKQGANPNKAGAPWSTPLSWAKKKQHVEIEKILAENINNKEQS